MGDPTRGEVPLNGVRSPVPSDVGEKLLGVSAGELPPSPQEFINPATSPAALAAADAALLSKTEDRSEAPCVLPGRLTLLHSVSMETSESVELSRDVRPRRQRPHLGSTALASAKRPSVPMPFSLASTAWSAVQVH